jgi:hypothetical protein
MNLLRHISTLWSLHHVVSLFPEMPLNGCFVRTLLIKISITFKIKGVYQKRNVTYLIEDFFVPFGV